MRTTRYFTGIVLWLYPTRHIEVQVAGNTVTGSGTTPPSYMTATGWAHGPNPDQGPSFVLDWPLAEIISDIQKQKLCCQIVGLHDRAKQYMMSSCQEKFIHIITDFIYNLCQVLNIFFLKPNTWDSKKGIRDTIRMGPSPAEFPVNQSQQ